MKVIEPSTAEILDFCAQAPVERVFLEDVARRGGEFRGPFGRRARFAAVRGDRGIDALCLFGTNIVPSGAGCDVFARRAARSRPRMIIGEERAVGELWEKSRRKLSPPRQDRPGQPVYASAEAPDAGESGLRPATLADLDLLVPACAAAHLEEIGVDPLRTDPDGFRWRTRMQVEEGRSWIWSRDGAILFKAEASAWTPSAVQLQQVWTDPEARRHGYASRALRDLIRLLLGQAASVCLFVRSENHAAIRLYDSVGMQRVLTYRSVLL